MKGIPLSFNLHNAGFANQLLSIETILGISYILQRPCIVYNTTCCVHHKQEKTINEYLNIPYNITFKKEQIPNKEIFIDFHSHVFYTESTFDNFNFRCNRNILYPEKFNKIRYVYNTGFGIYSSFVCGTRVNEIKFLLKLIKFNDEILVLRDKLLSKFNKFNALHIRKGDFKHFSPVCNYINSITVETIDYDIEKNFKKDIPIIIFTDDKSFYLSLKQKITDYKLIYFDDIAKFYTKSKDLISLLSLLIASESENFLGTWGSTFTGLIHRYRILNNKENNFLFITDSVHITDNVLPVGRPYSWNDKYYKRYENCLYWMREWVECK